MDKTDQTFLKFRKRKNFVFCKDISVKSKRKIKKIFTGQAGGFSKDFPINQPEKMITTKSKIKIKKAQEY